jgi:hypothetical protein
MSNQNFTQEVISLTKFDQALVEQLQTLREQAEQLRRSLYDRHPRCACDGQRVCVLHAAINNYLLDITDNIDHACDFLFKEGV